MDRLQPLGGKNPVSNVGLKYELIEQILKSVYTKSLNPHQV